MLLLTVPVGLLSTNCYIVACDDTREAAVIDPGDEASEILEKINDNNLHVKYIINTHAHWDHIGANNALKLETKAEVLLHKNDVDILQDEFRNLAGFLGVTETASEVDVLLSDGDIVEIGESISFEVLHTPGHTPGSICLLGKDILFSGDTLFSGSIGRTDLPGGSYKNIISSVNEKIKNLPEHLEIYPGHGPKTSVKEEKENNPFLKESSF